MTKFVLKEITDSYIDKELENIGFDAAYRNVAANKFHYKNIKIFNLTVAQANILKQTALIFGADCATNRNVITGKIELSDVILCGSFSQLRKIADKLKSQPFKLAILGNDIINFLEEKSRKTKLVGVLNITPNSFSDGGKYLNAEAAQKHLIQLVEDGADMIDIGAESTKSYAEAVTTAEQILRLKPVLEFIQKEKLEIPISIDTRSSEVADFALNNGAKIINDVSGFDYDSKMPEIVAKYQAGIIIQHSTKKTEDKPCYNNIIEEIGFKLNEKINLAESFGIKNIIIDPGIGFGKTREDNFVILDRIKELFYLNCPIMVGISRKSLFGITGEDNELKDAISAAHSYPLIKLGIDYLRVHNVKLHKTLINSLPM